MSGLQQPLLRHGKMRWCRASHCLGLLLIVLVALIWVAASQLIESIFKDESFDHPYFLTYFNTCGFTFWLLCTACRCQPSEPQPSDEGITSPRDEGIGLSVSSGEGARCSRLRKYGSMALIVSPAWLAANYLFNLSLDYTSVASNSMFSTTSNLWTMLFSVCFLGERLNPFHVLAVIFTMAGSALVALADADDNQKSSFVGDALALVSACVYGGYTVILKYCVPENEERLAMPTLFGCIGLLVLLFGWPFLLLFNFTGWEDFAWPSGSVFGTLVINALIGTNLSDVLWAYAVQLTTPLTATLGLSLTVPFGMISDALLRGKSFDEQYIWGALLVLCGFLLVSFAKPLWTSLSRAVRARQSAAHESCESSDSSEEFNISN